MTKEERAVLRAALNAAKRPRFVWALFVANGDLVGVTAKSPKRWERKAYVKYALVPKTPKPKRKSR